MQALSAIPRRRRTACRHGYAGGLALAALLLMAGCSGSADESASGESLDTASMFDGGAVASEDEAAGGGTSGAPNEGKGVAPGTAPRAAVQTRAVIRKGSITVVTPAMSKARGEVDDLVARHGGYLSSEDTSNDRAGRPQRSVLVLRLPEPAFDTAMSELGEIGRTQQADRSSEDVTTEVIDVDTRVATQEASLARLQRFLTRAGTVEDMIRLESEIASRQAALESLKAQQKYLADQTAMSTITVRLHSSETAPPPKDEETGFLAGLAGGWDALKAVLVGAATVAGAVLPFLLALLLLSLPTWLAVRHLAKRRRTPVVLPASETS